jgi:hypothetical protein
MVSLLREAGSLGNLKGDKASETGIRLRSDSRSGAFGTAILHEFETMVALWSLHFEENSDKLLPPFLHTLHLDRYYNPDHFLEAFELVGHIIDYPIGACGERTGGA